MRKLQQQTGEQQFGSYSSCQSYVEGNGASPDRRANTTTPDINHPYIHATQIIHKKKAAVTPGTNSKTRKYVVPNSVVESLGMQPNFNSALSTYNSAVASKARVLGQRKLSS